MTSVGNKLRRENVATTPRKKIKSNFVKSRSKFASDFTKLDLTFFLGVVATFSQVNLFPPGVIDGHKKY